MKPEDEKTFAKQQLGQEQVNNGGLLGLSWNKQACHKDKTVAFEKGLLLSLAKVCDPLGFVALFTVEGKFIFRKVCDREVAWEALLSEPLERK